MAAATNGHGWGGIGKLLLAGILAASLPVFAAPPGTHESMAAVDPVDEGERAARDEAEQQHLLEMVESLDDRVDAEGELARFMLSRLVRERASRLHDGAREGSGDPSTDRPDPQRAAALALAWRLANDDAAPELLPILLGTGVIPRGSPEWHELVAAAQRRQPTNLAIAAWQLGVGVPVDDEVAADVWFESTAEMDRYDGHFVAVVRLLFDVTRRQPLPPLLREALARTVDLGQADSAFADLVLPLGIAMAQAMPALQPLTLLCDPARAELWTSVRATHCQRIALTMATTADNELGEGIGLAMWARLVEGDAAIAVAERQRQRQWRLQAAIALGDVALASAWLQAIDQGLAERDVFRLALQDAGVPLLPPADWLPTSD
jgi:hypothetical protein